MGLAENIASSASGDARRFAAFISYSHADADAAAKLQRKLERYRLPKRIAETRVGDAAALGPIFRDREDLAAAVSLNAAICDAIGRAEALIVMCSPDAVASPWVAAEIDLFRELHPDKPILAVLLCGEPALSFPAALTAGGNEPLAADLRPDGDGAQLGFLKIVAGIAGLPLDTLIQRDAQRRIRRVTAITAGALAAMLIMGIMTTYAIRTRNEAARQRAAAEGLVEYMLTDLRAKLRGVGRIDVMDAVNDRAMAYYSTQGDLADLPADSLERRARILQAMGEDDNNSGKLDAALAKFREAHRATGELLSQEPANPDRIFAHAQSEYWVGQAAWLKRDRPTTTRYWQNYAARSRKLLSLDDDHARANREMGYALGNLCDLYLYENFDLDKAVDQCRRSIAFHRKALNSAPADPEIQMALANRYGWLADALVQQKKYSDARQARTAEQALVDRLVSNDPKNFELRFRQIWPEFGLILIAIEEGNEAASARRLVAINEKLEALSDEAPDNMEIKRAWARASYIRAKTLADIDPLSARAALGQTRRIVEEIAQTPTQREALSAYFDGMKKIERQLATGGQ